MVARGDIRSKWRAFFWGTVSGLAETVAGAIGWIIFSQRDGDMSWLAYAVLFGLVSGMMVYISFKELIVTALEYDVERKYVFLFSFWARYTPSAPRPPTPMHTRTSTRRSVPLAY